MCVGDEIGIAFSGTNNLRGLCVDEKVLADGDRQSLEDWYCALVV